MRTVYAVFDTNVLVSALMSKRADEDDKVFYEVALSKEDSYVVTGNIKHFPKSPIVVTPSEMMQIVQAM